MKIAICGTHSVGKTTLALDLAQAMQKTGLFSVTVLTELVRECPYPLGVNQTVDATHWLISRQISRELELKRHSSVVICDRSAIDAFVYTLSGGRIHEKDCALAQTAKDWLETYETIIWVRPGDFIVDDGFRMLDKEFRVRVDMMFEPYLKNCDNLIQINQDDLMNTEKRELFFRQLIEKFEKSLEETLKIEE